MNISSKKCTKCKENKELTEFCKSSRAKDGLNAQCRTCKKISNKIYSELPLDPIPEIKICTKCKISKKPNEFSKSRNGKDGLCSICRDCSKKSLKKWILLPLDPVSETKKCEKCKIEKSIIEFNKSKNGRDGFNSNCKKCQRIHKFKIRYKITIEDYDEMFSEQNGCCAICKKHQSENRKHNMSGKIANLCVDHCHETGKVRGLLCYGCNSGLGEFKDNYKALEVAAMYIKNNGFTKK